MASGGAKGTRPLYLIIFKNCIACIYLFFLNSQVILVRDQGGPFKRFKKGCSRQNKEDPVAQPRRGGLPLLRPRRESLNAVWAMHRRECRTACFGFLTTNALLSAPLQQPPVAPVTGRSACSDEALDSIGIAAKDRMRASRGSWEHVMQRQCASWRGTKLHTRE